MSIDIAFSLTPNISLSLLVAMNSIVKNTAKPGDLRFNLAVPLETEDLFAAEIDRAFPDRQFVVRIQGYRPPGFMTEYLDQRFGPRSPEQNNSRYMQYSRLFLGDIFPDLARTIYFDTDIIVLGDVRELFESDLTFGPDRYFAAVSQFFPAPLYFSQPWVVWSEIRQFQQSFNSGVFLTDFAYWSQTTYDRLRYYLDLDRRYNYKLFHLGDETVMNLMFKDYIPLDRAWNRCGYGNARLIGFLLKKPLSQVKVIHWSGGHHKPWKSKGIAYGQLWQQYNQFGAANSGYELGVV